MRWLGRLSAMLLAVSLALLGAGWIAAHWSLPSGTAGTPRISTEAWEKASRSTAYRISKDGWLFFPLLPNATDLKILTNAQLDLAAADLPEAANLSWRYAIAYRLFGGAGELVDEGRFHQRTRLGVTRLPNGQLQRTIGSADPHRATADGRVQLHPAPGSETRQLALRVAALEPPLEAVLARVFQREQVSPHKRTYLWSRLPATTRERLGQASIYGAELLRPKEMQELLSSLWVPLAPNGIVDRDFRTLTLYQLGADSGEPLAEAVAPSGLKLGAGHRGIVPIPSPGGRVQLELKALAEIESTATATADPESNSAVQVRIRWYGRPATRQAEWAVRLGDPFEAVLDGGLLEVESPSAAVLEARMLDAQGSERDITPEPRYLRAWQLRPGETLSYRVAHATESATPWRIDLRQILAAESATPKGGRASGSPALAAASPRPIDVSYRFLDASNQILREGVLRLDAPLSQYDRVARDDAAMLGEASPHFFLVPPTVLRIDLNLLPSDTGPDQEPDPRLDGSPESSGPLPPESAPVPTAAPAVGPVAVAAYSRPPGLPRERRVPPAPLGEAMPAWFPVRPQRWPELIREGGSVLLTLQPSPPQIAPELLAGEYRWDAFHPQDNWHGRHLLIPAEPGPVRTEALPHRFLRLELGAVRELTFPTSGKQVRAGLAYRLAQPTSPEPTLLRLSLDGETLLERRVRARSGELRLPPFPGGRHRVLFEAPTGTSASLSGTAESFGQSQEAVVRRLAAQLGPAPLSFSVPKEGWTAELLSLRLFGSMDAQAPQRLRVTLDQVPKRGVGPFSEWTLTERLFQLGPAPGGPVAVVQAPDARLDAGALMFIPLGSDLPPGDYRLTLDLEEGPGGYVTLSRTVPGRFPWRAVHREL